MDGWMEGRWFFSFFFFFFLFSFPIADRQILSSMTMTTDAQQQQQPTSSSSASSLDHPNFIRLKDGTLWFRETTALWPGQCMSLEVDRVLHHERTDYQDLLVFQSKTYGNVLVLDGGIIYHRF